MTQTMTFRNSNKRKNRTSTHTHTHKRARFTYVGKETRYITEVFKDTNVAVAFTTNNTIGKHLTKEYNTQRKYGKSGVYQLICLDCKMTYTARQVDPSKPGFKNTYETSSTTIENRHLPNTYWTMDTQFERWRI